MTMCKTSFVLAALMLTPMLDCLQSVHAASFDCLKAHSVPEKLICRDADLSERDDELAALHKRAKAAALDVTAFNAESVRQWKLRESLCSDKICLLAWYDQREKYLTEILSPTSSVTSKVSAKECDTLAMFAETVAVERDRGRTETQTGRMSSEFFKDNKSLNSAVIIIHKIYTEPLLLAMNPARVKDAYAEQCRIAFR